MMSRSSRPRSARRRIALWALALLLPATLVFSTHGLAAPGSSAATIGGSFANSCRAFAARSSKDISHVEIHYADGRVVKDESVTTPDYAIDGGAGDEINFAIVKSGTTIETFACPRTNSPPTALLEIQAPQDCFVYDDVSAGISYLRCQLWAPRTDWLSASTEYWAWDCPYQGDPSLCRPTFSFRGTGSTDPDDTIQRWSIDFGDGTSASGSWATEPPSGVTHAYPSDGFANWPTVTLTVTDAAGESNSHAVTLLGIDTTPD